VTVSSVAASLPLWQLLQTTAGALAAVVLSWAGLVGAAVLAFLFEAWTSQMDNLFLPLYYYACWLLVAGPAAQRA
jgi:dolichol kinase